MNPPAEEILRRLQRTVLERADAKPLAAALPPTDEPSSPRQTLRALESVWGASATRHGRYLDDLLQGSAAWELVEQRTRRPSKNHPPLPRLQEIFRCEPLLRIMRESGELGERERLLSERDAALNALWRDAALSEAERHQAAQAVYDGYFAEVARLSAAYHPQYQEMRRALSAIPPLTGLHVRSRPLLLPPLMAHLFSACHLEDKGGLFAPGASGEGGFVAERRGRGHAVRSRAATEETLALLDEMTFDIAAVAVIAFFTRAATASDADARFPLLIDDYFEWRGVDPRKRTLEARQQIDARIRLLSASDSLSFEMRTELWRLDPEMGRRRKTEVATRGAFLRRHSSLYRPSPWLSETENEPLFGHLVSLGEWARPFIEERAMVGIYLKRLAEYDLRRQQWERRIGWYVMFQMHNQGTKMTFQDADGDGKGVRVTPQHSLRMKTVLQNSHVPYEEMARANPGKVIKQWIDALDTLRRDGILESYACLDGAADGSDLPTRSRLSAMMVRRYLFVPGGALSQRLRRKSAARRGAG